MIDIILNISFQKSKSLILKFRGYVEIKTQLYLMKLQKQLNSLSLEVNYKKKRNFNFKLIVMRRLILAKLERLQ